jgi:hypothetical protein
MKRLSFGLQLRPRIGERNRSPFAIPGHVRQAQLSGSPVFDRVRVFGANEWLQLEAFRPQVLIGSASRLKQLSEEIQAGQIDFNSVDHAVFILTSCGEAPVDDVFRVLLWQSFGVPVYELLVTEDGELLAADCEAQEGWHLQSGIEANVLNRELHLRTAGGRLVHSGLTAEISAHRCPCGRATCRITNAERLRRPALVRRLAATA